MEHSTFARPMARPVCWAAVVASYLLLVLLGPAQLGCVSVGPVRAVPSASPDASRRRGGSAVQRLCGSQGQCGGPALRARQLMWRPASAGQAEAGPARPRPAAREPAPAPQDAQFDSLLRELEASPASTAPPAPQDPQFDTILRELEASSPASKPSPAPESPLASKDQAFDTILNELEAAAVLDRLDEDVEEEQDVWAWFRETFSWVLVADVFTVFALAGWFLLGVTLSYGLGIKDVLDAFELYWDPYFQSLLGILFGARILSFGVSSAMGWNDDF